MNKETAVVIIPTYNEAGSIGQIIDYLVTDTFPGIKNWDMRILAAIWSWARERYGAVLIRRDGDSKGSFLAESEDS